MQVLYAMVLSPIAEALADPNSCGFRPKRSTADASCQCFINLARKCSAKWVLEADIKACFDNINHINTGFDFLGFNIRKYKEKRLIKPAKENIKRLLEKVRDS